MTICPFRPCFNTTTRHDTRQKTVCAKIEKMGLEVLPWPAQSPDLNPIENAWKVLKNRVAGEKYANEDELWQAVQKTNGRK